jgi:hypothetical protein
MRVRPPRWAGGLDEATPPHARADHPQAPGGRAAAAEGHEVPEVAKQLEISEATYHRWRTQYGGLKADDAKRLEELEGENARLKRIVAD